MHLGEQNRGVKIMDIKISPSVLACDLSRLGEECAAMANAGAHMIHLDVMDGHFVPNISFGAPVIKELRDKSDIIFDTHLMISKPQDYIDDFAAAGSDIITFHVEADCNIEEALKKIKTHGKKCGLVLKPATDIDVILPYLDMLDMVLIMTVEPGFGGQKFMEDMLHKITDLRSEIDRRNLNIDIQVDGGINDETAMLAVKAGANVLVAGSYLFGQNDYKAAVKGLLEIVR